MSHLRTDYEGRLLRVWQQMLEELNGPQDLLIVDSASPLPISDYLDLTRPWYLQIAHDDQQMKTKGDRSIIRFNDKRGHPFWDNVTHGSGSDRAMMMGFQTAINSGYERVVYLEMDLLFARPLAEAYAMMTKPAACLPLVGHGKFPETGLFIADCKHMDAIRFVDRYCWRGPCSPEGELRQWRIYGDDLQFLPFDGARGYAGKDWTTHVTPDIARAFLKDNMMPHLAEML